MSLTLSGRSALACRNNMSRRSFLGISLTYTKTIQNCGCFQDADEIGNPSMADSSATGLCTGSISLLRRHRSHFTDSTVTRLTELSETVADLARAERTPSAILAGAMARHPDASKRELRRAALYALLTTPELAEGV